MDQRTPRTTRPRLLLAVAFGLLVAAGIAVAALLNRSTPPPKLALPLHQTGHVALPGDTSRYDYASLDPDRHLLFIAHLGASQVIEVDTRTSQVVRAIDQLADVHGVLAVPALHRVYATATGTNELAILDEDTGQLLHRSPTGDYPDGIAYDPVYHAVWTTNESGGTETVLDATTGAVLGTVPLGGEAGNVAYDPATGHMLVDVQTRNQLADINPATRRLAFPGCDHDHGLTLDTADRLAFVACDGNARLLTVDLARWQTTGNDQVGDQPDVLAYDAPAHRLYVAAESGWLTTFDLNPAKRQLNVTGRAFLADNAHIVAVDPATHTSYYPVPQDNDGHPAVLTYQPSR